MIVKRQNFDYVNPLPCFEKRLGPIQEESRLARGLGLLQRIMLGDTGVDLSALTEEMRELVEKALKS